MISRIRSQRGPAEHRHAHKVHAPGAQLQHGGDEIDAGDQRADAGNFQRPQIIVDADAGRVGQLRQRRVGQPAGARELADDKRYVDQQRAGGGEPEADRVQGRKRHIANPELQGDHQVHQADHERHRHKEDHDGAVGGKDLVEVLGRQIALRMKGQRLLPAHHDGVGKSAQQHHHGEQRVHHADSLVVDAGDPFLPEIGEVAPEHDPGEDAENTERHHGGCDHRNRLIDRNCGPIELTEHRTLRCRIARPPR